MGNRVHVRFSRRLVRSCCVTLAAALLLGACSVEVRVAGAPSPLSPSPTPRTDVTRADVSLIWPRGLAADMPEEELAGMDEEEAWLNSLATFESLDFDLRSDLFFVPSGITHFPDTDWVRVAGFVVNLTNYPIGSFESQVRVTIDYPEDYFWLSRVDLSLDADLLGILMPLEAVPMHYYMYVAGLENYVDRFFATPVVGADRLSATLYDLEIQIATEEDLARWGLAWERP